MTQFASESRLWAATVAGLRLLLLRWSSFARRGGLVHANLIRLSIAVSVFIGANPTYAQGTATTAPSTYVSSEFKTVAKNLAEQYIGDALANACPNPGLVCRQLVSGLADALDAAIDNDTDRLRLVLTKYFVSSAITGATSYLVDDLLDPAKLALSPKESKAIKTTIQPLVSCLLGLLRQDRNACEVPSSFEKSYRDLGVLNEKDGDFARLNGMLVGIGKGKRPAPADLVLALEALASSRLLKRYDI